MFISIKRIFFLSFFIFGLASTQYSECVRIEEVEGESSSSKYPLKITSVALEKTEGEFKSFCKVSQKRRDNLQLLKLLHGFSKKNGVATQFSGMCRRILSKDFSEVRLSLGKIAKLLAVKTGKKITEKDLKDYIKKSKKASYLSDTKSETKHKELFFFYDFLAFSMQCLSEGSKEDVNSYSLVSDVLESQGIKVVIGEEVLFKSKKSKKFNVQKALRPIVLLRYQSILSLDLSGYSIVGQFLSCYQTDKSLLEENLDSLSVSFANGKIMYKGKPFSAAHVIWALDLKGFMRIDPGDRLYESALHHHHLFYGVDIACAGHIIVKDGKIFYLTNGSGHYMPTIVHLMLAVKYFDKLGLFSKDLDGMRAIHGPTKYHNLQEVLSLSRMIELNP
ncbi:MAG TPA: hypothetical protein DD412_03565 [Holosporales bacterium]|nr:hypothetical protein [Holosporales bacterium]